MPVELRKSNQISFRFASLSLKLTLETFDEVRCVKESFRVLFHDLSFSRQITVFP